ncbi:hypothetical protein QBC44DRAFT_247501 [Cladorrhinum sp. PSN332]|nr:hypothetical protein QBC44DRAFT_247501 [Cladorrhinum sp. PSN332]
MPVLQSPPPGSTAQKPPVIPFRQPQSLDANIYLALGVLAILVVVHLIKSRVRTSHTTLPSSAAVSRFVQEIKHHQDFHTTRPNFSHNPLHPSASSPWPWLKDKLGGIGLQSGLVSQLQEAVRAAKPLPFSPRTGLLRPFGRFGLLPTMGGIDGDLSKDQSGSASRGVSTSAAGALDLRDQDYPSLTGTHSAQTGEERRKSSSTHSSTSAASIRHESNTSDGDHGQQPEGQVKGSMLGSAAHADGIWHPMIDGEPSSASSRLNQTLAQAVSSLASVDLSAPRQFSNPPPSLPLTPHGPSNVVFPFQDRRPSYAVSIPPELDTSFIHQPNPEYGASSTSANVGSSSPQTPSAIPRRRSYTRSIPIPTMSSASSAESMSSATTFSPSSYPPSSPLLPPPPPVHDAPPEYVVVGGPGGPGVFLMDQEIDIHGEIISVMDEEGHGWKRHTRVYGGGGSCLACLSSEDQGGFYGDKVPLSDRR